MSYRDAFSALMILLIFVLGLMSGYALASIFPVADYISGLTGIMGSPDSVVQMDESVMNALFVLWDAHKGTEFLACLNGRYDAANDLFIIDGISGTQLLNQSATSVTYQPCTRSGMLGSIHSHPSGACRQSDVDLYTFGSTGEKLSGVMCAKRIDGLAFWSASNVNERLRVSIVK